MKKIIVSTLLILFITPVISYAQTDSSSAPGAVQPATIYTGSYPPVAATAQASSVGISSCQNLNGFPAVAACALGIINLIIPVIIAITVVWTIYSSFNLVRTEGDDRKKWGWAIFYGLLGIFLMISIYGLVAIFTGTFGFSGNNGVTVPNLNNAIHLSQ